MNRFRILPLFIALNCLPLVAQAKPAPAPTVGPVVGGLTLITFSGQNVPLSTIERIFTDASNLAIKGKAEARSGKHSDIEGKTISVDWKDTPFWQAAREVELKTGLQWSIVKPGRMTLEASGPQNSYSPARLMGTVVAQSPYVLVMANPQQDNNSNAGHPVLRFGHLSMTAFIDPAIAGLTPLFDKLDLIQNGTPLPQQPISTNSGFIMGGIGERIKTLETLVHLDAPNSATVQASGVLDMTIPAATQLWTVPDLLNVGSLTQTAGNRKYVLESAQLPTDGQKLTLHFSLSTPDTVSDEDNSSYFKSLTVFDKKGHPLVFKESTLTGPSTQPDGSTHWKYEVNFINSADSKPIQGPLRMELGMAVTPQKKVELPFEKVDLDLWP